jgi:hypothetical protein
MANQRYEGVFFSLFFLFFGIADSSDWDQMAKCVELLDQKSVVGSFLRSIIALQKEDYVRAKQLVNETRYFFPLSFSLFSLSCFVEMFFSRVSRLA